MKKHTVTTLQTLEQEAWQLKKSFLEIIEPYRSDLWRYCRHLTYSPWDAEDLVQETLLKALASLGQIWQPLHTKSYLFRIATNTWINQQRREKKITFIDYNDDLEHVQQQNTEDYNVYESIEILAKSLPPMQALALLLIDVFKFTAKETAEMLTTSEGAVKALLHRARKNIKGLNSQQNQESNSNTNQSSEKKGNAIPRKKEYPMPDPQLINAIIDSFHKRDPEAMAKLFMEHAHNDIVHIGQEFGRETMKDNSIKDTFKHWTGTLKAHFQILWERPVVIVFIDTESGWQLKSIIYLETQDGFFTYKKEYYFCEDLLLEAAKELGVSVHERGW